MVRAYGTESWDLLGDAKTADDLGRDFGATLTKQEVRWMIDKEYVHRAEDVVWRRSKLGLRMQKGEIEVLDNWISRNL